MADAEADYMLAEDGCVRANALCEEVEERYRAAAAERQRLGRRWAATVLARVFRIFPWLAEVRLAFEASFEYDDAGGYYRCMSLCAEEVRPVPAVRLPEDGFPDGKWVPGLALDLIDAELEDDNFELCEALANDPALNEELKLHLARDRIALLLAQERIHGTAILAALLPELDEGQQQGPSD